MSAILEYLQKVQALVAGLPKVEIERYEEQVLSRERGNLRIRLRFTDNSLLEVSEAIHIVAGTFTWLSYRYHYQKPDGSVIFRYDDTPHHSELSTHPHHKHTADSVVISSRPDVANVLFEVIKHLKASDRRQVKDKRQS